MNRRASIVAAFAAGVLCSTVVAWSTRQGIAQQAPAPPADVVGRYRIAASEDGSYVFVLDTMTGHCWRRLGNGAGGWRDLGSPAAPDD